MSRLAQLCAALFLGLWVARVSAEPAQPILTITAGAVTNHFTVAELLSRADLDSLQILPEVDYNVSLTFQAVPLLDLLAGLPFEGFDRLEASATDGFVAQIPVALIEAKSEDRLRGSPSRAQTIPGPSFQGKMPVPALSI